VTDAEILALRQGAETPVRATRDQIGQVAEDLSAAFAQDPQFLWFLRTDQGHDQARLRLFYGLLLGSALPDGVVQRPACGGAAAIWLPSESFGPTPLIESLRSLPRIAALTGLARLPRMIAMRKAMDANHPKDRPHAYLWFLGVRPEAQGYGVGSRLLAAGLREVDAQGRHAFLESSNPANVSLYERHGFDVVKTYRARPDGPPFFAMWREARPALQ
jgi:ribosomal protein S18 acetylase RimI-like enzyme